MRRFRVAVAQIAPTLGDLEKNLALHEKMAREAIAQSANLLIFPELSLTGYFLKDQVPSVALPPRRPGSPALPGVEPTDRHRRGVRRGGSRPPVLQRVRLLRGRRDPPHPSQGLSAHLRHLRRSSATSPPGIGSGPSTRRWAAWRSSSARTCGIRPPPPSPPGTAPRSSSARRPAPGGAWDRPVPSRTPPPGSGRFAPGETSSPRFVVYANRVGYEDGACFWGGSEVVGPVGRAARQGPLSGRGAAAGRRWIPAASDGRGSPIRSSGTNGWTSRRGNQRASCRLRQNRTGSSPHACSLQLNCETVRKVLDRLHRQRGPEGRLPPRRGRPVGRRGLRAVRVPGRRGAGARECVGHPHALSHLQPRERGPRRHGRAGARASTA